MTQSAMFSLLALSTPVVSVIVGIICVGLALPLGMFLSTFLSKKKKMLIYSMIYIFQKIRKL